MALPLEVEKSYKELFESLDDNKDGTVDITELTEALTKKGLLSGKASIEAKKFFEKSDLDKSETLDVNEFILYMVEHEKALHLAFQNLDRNNDGKIDIAEVIHSFRDLGVYLTRSEAEGLLKRLDKDDSLTIEWEEWKDFLLLQTSTDVRDILQYWRCHTAIIDIGSDVILPADFTEEEMKAGLWWRHLVSGGIAGAVSRTSTHPLERLKVLLQAGTTVQVNGATQHLGIFSGFRYMVEEGGWRSLWRGNGILVLKLAPDTAIRFATYEEIKKLVKGDSNRELTPTERMLCGASAGAIGQTVVYPTEVLKTRLCLRKTGQYSGITDCARQILRTEGIRSFTRGYVPTVLSILPNAGLDLAIYETLKNAYLEKYQTKVPSYSVLLGCGTVSCICGQVASYPLQMVRTRLQASAAKGDAGVDSMTGIFRSVFRREGVKGLYRGCIANLMKMVPACSINYVVYEHVKQMFGVDVKGA